MVAPSGPVLVSVTVQKPMIKSVENSPTHGVPLAPKIASIKVENPKIRFVKKE